MYFVKNLIEMVVERDIVAVSIPFSAGVATAAALSPGVGAHWWAAAACSIALVLAFTLFCRRGSGRIDAAALFFIEGAFCWFTACAGVRTGNWLQAFAEGTRAAFSDLTAACGFGDPATAPLLDALLAGDRSGLDREITETFRKAGASHILALSGLHLGVIYGIVRKALSILGNSRAAAAARSITVCACTGLYTIATGAAPSTVRAFIFICTNELAARLPGRKRDSVNVLLGALTIQLAADPMQIRSVGFQLSYLAIAGIMLLYPSLRSWYPGKGRRDPVRAIWNSAAMSISCQVFTAPVVWWHFHSFPTSFLLTNLVALPLTELLITVSVPCLTLSAAGICPEILKGLVDMLGKALRTSLYIISSM